MKTKPHIYFWAMTILSLLLILPSCMSTTGAHIAMQPTNISIFNNKKIAVLPAKMLTSLGPDSVITMRFEVNKRIAPALQVKIPSAIITGVADVVNQLNQTNSLANFEQLISSYETTGVMDKRQVTTLGQALGCDFLLISRLKAERLDFGFISTGTGASLDIMLVNTSTSEIVWAGSGEWKKAGMFGQGDAEFSEFADNIINPALASLQSNGTTTPNATTAPETKEHPVTTRQANPEKQKVSRKVITQAQQQLLDLGYEPGPADGKLGQGTIKAIKKFQKENNLTETGLADIKTINMLEQKTKEQSTQLATQPQTTTTTPQGETTVTPVSVKTPETAITEQNTAPVKTVSPMDL